MRTTILTSFAIASGLCAVGALGACSPYSPVLGNQPFLCDTTEPVCPEGYTCTLDDGTQMMVCLAAGAMIVDAAPVGFQCRDDVGLETGGGAADNDTIGHAFPTGVGSPTRTTITFASAICPEGDKDVYQLMTNMAMQDILVNVSWDDGQPMSAAILNSGGTSIASGTSDGPTAIKAAAANLPTGIYYAQVSAGPATKNNYKVIITLMP